MSAYADLIERLLEYHPCLNPETAICDRPTVDAAADAISRLEREKAELRAALLACAGWLDGFDSSLGDFAREALSRTQEPPHAHKDA